MGLEDRVRNCFKQEKRRFYIQTGGRSDPEGFNAVWLALARKFGIPVRQVKDIVNPGGYFGGGPDE